MFFVTRVVYVIRCIISFIAARIIGIKSLVFLKIIIRAVPFEGFHKIYLIKRCERYYLTQLMIRNINKL